MKTPITDYYDRNTRRFLRFSPAGSAATIHRAVWAEGVTSRTDAVHHVHELLLRYSPAVSGVRTVWDLGCGVGASIEYLCGRMRAHYLGVTISNVQCRLATSKLRATRSASTEPGFRARIALADFCDPSALASLRSHGDPDLVYMIESFGHAPDPDPVIAAVAAALRPGGRLVICDDMLESKRARDEAVVHRFQHGWRIATLLTARELADKAQASGLRLVTNLDLTPFVENGRPRDRLIRAIVAMADLTGFSATRVAQTPFWLNLFGGDALQRATASGMIQYRFIVFEKPSGRQDVFPPLQCSAIMPT
jgi:SAM-dependent methyltransferase